MTTPPTDEPFMPMAQVDASRKLITTYGVLDNLHKEVDAQRLRAIAAEQDVAALNAPLSSTRTRAESAEAKVATLTAERDALRDALMVQTRRANGCVRGCACLDGGVGWGAKGCVCADDCSRMAADFPSTPSDKPSPATPEQP